MKWIRKIAAAFKKWFEEIPASQADDFSMVDNFATDDDAPFFTDGQ